MISYVNILTSIQVAKLNYVTKNLLRKIEVTEKELKEIKTQYHDSQDDNTEFRQNLLKVMQQRITAISQKRKYQLQKTSLKIVLF